MNVEKSVAPVGILNVNEFSKNCSLIRFYPQQHLKQYVEHYWYISWQLPDDKHHQQSVIPHPNTHLTFIRNNSHIQGVYKKKYTHTLSGSGDLIGVKFTPAGFYAFAKQAGLLMNQVCNTVISIDDMFNVDSTILENRVFSCREPLEKIALIDEVLLLPIVNELEEDKNIDLLNTIVAEIAQNTCLMKVSDVCLHFSISQRQIQRLFSQYIGVSVKWIISRYRIHEALTLIDRKEDHDCFNWADLAVKLGYYDQAHFSKTFSQLVGQSPDEYQRSIQ